MSFNSVALVGLGYIGLPTAVLLALHKVQVIGIDVSQRVVDSVNAGELHIVEPGLDVLLKEVVDKGYLRATTKAEPADAFIIAVPTPFYHDHKPDVSYIKAAAEAIAPFLSKENLIILESTSPVGTTEKLEKWLAELRPDLVFPTQAQPHEKSNIYIAYCPERVLPGNVLCELVHNERIAGGLNAISAQKAEELYGIFVKSTVTHTNARIAEMTKLTENSFRDVNIAFANELSIICDALNIDVWELISLANKHPRVHILQPGCGVGGHCIAVDPWFIVDKSPKEARIIRMARTINDYKPQWIVEKVKATIFDVLSENPQMRIFDVSVACLGLAFKPDTNDLRESPAMQITTQIAQLGCKTMAVEPYIHKLPQKLLDLNVEHVSLHCAFMKADILCVLVKHSVFEKSVDEGKYNLQDVHIVDAVNLNVGQQTVNENCIFTGNLTVKGNIDNSVKET